MVREVILESLHKKMEFSIKDFFSKCDQIRKNGNLVTFTEEILNGRLHFLFNEMNWAKLIYILQDQVFRSQSGNPFLFCYNKHCEIYSFKQFLPMSRCQVH